MNAAVLPESPSAFLKQITASVPSSLLIVTTFELHRLTTEAVVAQMVQGHRHTFQDVTSLCIAGRAPDLMDLPRESRAILAHEFQWLAASDTIIQMQRLLASTSGAMPTHILYLDPWAFSLDRTWTRPAARALLWDDIPMDDHRNYWTELMPWIHQQTSVSTVSARDLMHRLGTSWWPTQTTPGSGIPAWLERLSAPILIEESRSVVPNQARLERYRSIYPEPVSLILLSPHLATYRNHAASAVAQFTLALDPSEITPSMYAQVLGHVHGYIAPDGLPWGATALHLLSPHATLYLRPEDARSVQRPAVSLPAGLDTPLRETQPSLGPINTEKALRPHPQMHASISDRTLDMSATANLAHWWAQLPEPTAKQSLPASPIMRERPALALTSTTMTLPDLAILVVCHKYLQRFRIFLQSLVRQQHALSKIELCVAAPGNPDGLHEYLRVVRMAHPDLSIHLVEVGPDRATNKGKMLNAAFRASSAPLIMVSDVDLVLGPDFVCHMMAQHRPDRILGCWRTPLNKDITAQILCGNLDPVDHFDVLKNQWDVEECKNGVRQGMLGYCQIVTRAAFAQVGYPEEFEGYNQSDIVFVERLQHIGLQNHFLTDYHVLHLSHHRNWAGTQVFL